MPTPRTWHFSASKGFASLPRCTFIAAAIAPRPNYGRGATLYFSRMVDSDIAAGSLRDRRPRLIYIFQWTTAETRYPIFHPTRPIEQGLTSTGASADRDLSWAPTTASPDRQTDRHHLSVYRPSRLPYISPPRRAPVSMEPCGFRVPRGVRVSGVSRVSECQGSVSIVCRDAIWCQSVEPGLNQNREPRQ